MAPKKDKRWRRYLQLLLIMAIGLFCCGKALWQLGQTAIFVHEADAIPATVVDMVRRPFQDSTEALSHGNLPWEGDTAYQAIVSFTLPTQPLPISFARHTLPDLDNRDHAIGEQVELLVPLTDPAQAHLHRFKFQWGSACILLGIGLLLSGFSYLMIRRPNRRYNRQKSAPPAKKTPPCAKTTPLPRPAPKQAPQEEPFRLESTPPPPKKKRSRKPKDPNAPAKPRSRKKKSVGS